MKPAILLILCLLIFPPLTFYRGQEPSAHNPTIDVPTLEQVLDRYVQALGGKSAIEKINSRASKGTFTSDKLRTNGPMELYAKTPNKQLMVLLAKGFGNYRRGFNGTVAWELYPGSDKANRMSGFSKRDADFYLAIKFRETYPNVALKGLEKLGERETSVLEAPAAGNPKRWYFDSQTGLLLRAESRNSSGKVLESVSYNDYRIVDGIQEPFNIRIVDRDGTDFNIKLSEVKHNVPIADVSFDEPEKKPQDRASANSPTAKPEVRFTSGNSATIPFEIDDDNEVFKIRVNDSPPLRFTIDTGSDVFAIITGSQAKRLGLTARDNYKVGVASVGEIEAASIPSAKLSLPGVEALNQRIEVIVSDEPADNGDQQIDGTLGFRFLKHFVVEIDYEAKTIKFFSTTNYKYHGSGEIIPVKIKDGTPMARLKLITASGKTIDSYFEIDSGLGGTFLFFTPAVKKYGLLEDMRTIQSPTSFEISGEYHRRIGRAKSVQLGSFMISNLPVSLSQNAEGSGIDGTLGEEVLRRFKVIFDFSHHRMILEPNSHFKEPYEEDMSGIALTAEKNGGQKLFRIRQVVPNTPASEAGLQADDLITAIDGLPAANFTEAGIERMFKQAEREFALTIKRGEKVIQVKLKLRRLI